MKCSHGSRTGKDERQNRWHDTTVWEERVSAMVGRSGDHALHHALIPKMGQKSTLAGIPKWMRSPVDVADLTHQALLASPEPFYTDLRRRGCAS
jgi:hypothetical protein